MKNLKLKSIALLMIFGLMIQSCSEDGDLLTLDSTEEFRGGGGNNNGGNGNGGGGNGNGGNGGGNNNNQDVGGLDITVTKEWTDLYVALDRYSTGMRPNATARAIAYINLAAYETAQPGMRDHISLDNRLNGLSIDNLQRDDRINYEIALNTVYADVLDHFFLELPGSERAKIEELELQLAEDFVQGVDNDVIEDSEEWGEYVGRRVIEYSQTDQEAEKQILEPQPLSYEPPTGEGYWTYSGDPERALFPYWGSVRTFVVDTDETTTIEPMAYSQTPGSGFYEQMMEVYIANNKAKAEQGEQLHIAEFWSDDVENLMMSPPGRQVSIASQLIDQMEMNLEDALTLLVKLGFSLNDAAVSTWKYKYEHMVMRPSVYIQDLIDPDFSTNLFKFIYWPNPSFPGYPSGHSCFASAAGGVFADFFGDTVTFTDRSHEGRTEFLSEPRTFTSFTEMAEENAFSRIPLGVHIAIDCEEGVRLGYEISDGINDLNLNRRGPGLAATDDN